MELSAPSVSYVFDDPTDLLSLNSRWLYNHCVIQIKRKPLRRWNA